jgi:hypothetical protein
MPTSQPRNSNLLDRSNRQERASYASTLRYGALAAASDLSDKAKPSIPLHSMHAQYQDPFAYYKAFVDTSSSQGSDKDEYTQDSYDGYTCHAMPEAGDVSDIGGHPPTRGRGVPYNLAVRLANRSNGAPLATIVEQGSYSTLNSHGSLLSVGRLPSIRLVENASPSRTSHKVSRSLDENALQRIQEDACQEKTPRAPSGAQEQLPYNDHGKAYPASDVATSFGSTPLLHSQLEGPQIGETDYCDANNRTVKGFFRGVLHNVRAASRTRSRSSSTHAEHRGDRPETSDDSPPNQVQASETSQYSNDRFDAPFDLPSSSLSATTTPGCDYHTRNRQSSSTDSQSSARPDLPLLNVHPHVTETQTGSGTVPQLLPPSAATRSRERSASVRLVPPEPRDAAQNGCSVGAPMLSNEGSDNISAGHAFYGVSVPSNNASSLTEHDRAREASRNASFCSTMSTSYSGTVVGVDVDLEHDFAHPVRRSHSPTPTPVTPVWFTPQMAELERQASVSESPTDTQQLPEAEYPPRSITSSALTSLLPIAAASGIIRTNYNTPKISFYSPSGNLIQPEGSSTPGTTSISDFSSTPATTTSYVNKNTPATYSAFPATTCLPPPRPSLRPMTTPPTSSAPLPAHLRHHHNYRRPEKSQIDSATECTTTSFIMSTPEVKGCGGIIGPESLIPHTGMRHSHERNKSRPHYRRHRSAKSFAEDLNYEARFHRARLITAVIRCCTSTEKGRVLRKRQVASRRAAATAYTTMPHNRTSEAAGTKRRPAKNKRDVGLLGPLAGHILRICFCQPYDGAGKPTHAVAANTLRINRHAGSMHDKSNKETPRSELDIDAVLPNARVVSGSEKKKENSVRKRTTDPKSGTAGKEKRTTTTSSKHTRMRSDSAVSVGVALRTATVGG